MVELIYIFFFFITNNECFFLQYSLAIMAIQRNKFLKIVIKSNEIIHKIESNNKPHQITTTTTAEATISCVLCCNWCEVIHLLKYEMYFKCMIDHFDFIVAFNAFFLSVLRQHTLFIHKLYTWLNSCIMTTSLLRVDGLLKILPAYVGKWWAPCISQAQPWS